MARPPRSAARDARKARRKERRQGDSIGVLPAAELTRRPTRPQQADVRPLTETQAEYDDAIRLSRVIFGVGPAGTGKTYFAACRAAEALLRGEIEKIYITRPAVEAEEEFGFLPGDLAEKYEPYLAPVKDALVEKFGSGHLEYLIKSKVIEPLPLAFMRGKTIKNAWLIADEMQNATIGQFKMLLTRIGKDSKFIINGDPRQSDLPSGQSGLLPAMKKVGQIAGITEISFTHADIVRDDICQEIVTAFES